MISGRSCATAPAPACRSSRMSAGIFQLFDAMYVGFNAALRGAGDTFVPAMVTAVLCWSITVAGGYWVARTWPQLGVIGPWSAATVYGVILGLFIWLRFLRG